MSTNTATSSNGAGVNRKHDDHQNQPDNENPQQEGQHHDQQHQPNSRESNHRVTSSILGQIRITLTPYLPPPVISLIHTIDHHPLVLKWMPFSPTTTPSTTATTAATAEPSVMILTTILFIYVLKKILSNVFYPATRQKRAIWDDNEYLIHDLPEDQVLNDIRNTTAASYKDTVILFGPSGSGKSLLFCKIANLVPHLYGSNYDEVFQQQQQQQQQQQKALQKNINTVMSLKANVQILQSPSDNNMDSHDKGQVASSTRLIDYPGHKTLFPKLLGLLLPCSCTRALLTVDSTKSLVEAAWMLYNILTHEKFVQEWSKKKDDDGLHIMVVCTKSDLVNAKNWRRIKIQLRNEMEALRKVSSSVSSKVGLVDGMEKDKEIVLSGKSIDLDDLIKNGIMGVKLSFMSYSATTGEGLKDLCDFVMQGRLPQH
eukprot:CAMPEP_0176495872 /NCGR_PEP_ID=MMETSP0200_2-20121128/10895_1 /TAXON_ID=947934 /ORGANISM="Chaetoceros sp., Strain GSL56" /LENGTH=427 /DNA_ID=CAMNT_0017893793 /DNA_START=109 /DNA_END=1389 /DNA_ORIENTATION=+